MWAYVGFRSNEFTTHNKPQRTDDIVIHPKYREGFLKYGNRTDLTLEERVYTLYGIALIRLKEDIIVLKYKFKILSICLANTTAEPIESNRYVMFGRFVSMMTPRQIVDNPLLANITDQTTKDLYNRLSFTDRSLTNQSRICPVIIDCIWRVLVIKFCHRCNSIFMDLHFGSTIGVALFSLDYALDTSRTCNTKLTSIVKIKTTLWDST